MSLVSSVETSVYQKLAAAKSNIQNMSEQEKFALPDKKTEEIASRIEKPLAVARSQLAPLLGTDAFATVVQATGASEASTSQDIDDANSPEAEFLKFMDMTPAERYFASMLKEKGYTQEEYEALPPDEKLKIQNEIQEAMRKNSIQRVTAGQVQAGGEHQSETVLSMTQPATNVASVQNLSTEKDHNKLFG